MFHHPRPPTSDGCIKMTGFTPGFCSWCRNDPASLTDARAGQCRMHGKSLGWRHLSGSSCRMSTWGHSRLAVIGIRMCPLSSSVDSTTAMQFCMGYLNQPSALCNRMPLLGSHLVCHCRMLSIIIIVIIILIIIEIIFLMFLLATYVRDFANIFAMKRDINNQEQDLNNKGSLYIPRIWWTLARKRLLNAWHMARSVTARVQLHRQNIK